MIEKLVRDEVTRTGQHWIEVMRMGKKVEAEKWTTRAPLEVEGLVHAFERHEKALDVWRLYVRWPAREVVKVAGAADIKGEEAVLWYLDKGQTVRNGMENAAATWWLRTGTWPTTGWMWTEPPQNKMVLEDATRLEGRELCLDLRCGLWVPKGYVLVSGRQS